MALEAGEKINLENNTNKHTETYLYYSRKS